MRMLIFVILYALVGVICGIFCARVARSKNYSPRTWFLAGFFFSVIALLAIVGMPPNVRDNYRQ